MATAKDVDRTLRELIRRFGEAGNGRGNAPQADRTLLCRITDLDLAYRAEYTGGRLHGLKRIGEPAEADVVVSCSSDELIALAEGRSSVTMALLLGRLRVDAGAGDLLMLRQLF